MSEQKEVPCIGGVWQCRIGSASQLPPGADGPLRDAVEAAYEQLVGKSAEACFSGWGNEFSESELAVIQNRLPDPELCAVVIRANDPRLSVTVEEFEAMTQELSALREWQQWAFAAHPNIDIDIEVAAIAASKEQSA